MKENVIKIIRENTLTVLYVFIEKKFANKWTYTVQTHVGQGSIVP